MKSKKIAALILFSSFALVAGVLSSSVIAIKSHAQDNPQILTSDIVVTKPGKGETISVLPDALSQFMGMDDLLHNYQSRADEIGELTSYNSTLFSWTNHMGQTDSDIEYRRNIFDKYDLFHPTNNILSWESKFNAKNYKVIVSQDKSFSIIEREYEVPGSTNYITLTNPYTGTDYYWQVIATKNDDSVVYSDVFNFSTANLPRTIYIDGVSNTRDLGGNVGLNGKRMKEGLVYRGMGLEAITDAGKEEFLNNLGIKSEVDLRGSGEGIENFLHLPTSNYHHHSAPYMISNNNSGINYFGEGSLVESFGQAVKVFANKNNYPVYFHCAIGRDRTGWLGICLDLLCGVSEEAALKEFCLSLFSVSGAHNKGTLDFYNRYLSIRDYINSFSGENLSEKMEDYLVNKAGVTHEECQNIRNILLGDEDTGFVPGETNPDSYTGLVKVTFRRQGEPNVIKMVESGSLLEKPTSTGNGEWRNGNVTWDFDHDVVTEDIYLDYVASDKCKVMVSFTGIDLPNLVIDVDYNTYLDYSIFEKDGYTFKVYDESYNRLNSCLVKKDIIINVVYLPVNGFVPKSNSRVIVMAGQSNAAGVGHFQYLHNSLDEDKINEIETGYSNVLISGYSTEMIPDFSVVRADKYSRMSGTPGTFGFEVGLADRLSKAFPNETTYILKCAHGATSLNYEFISPSMRDVIPEVVPPIIEESSRYRGILYDRMVDQLTSTLRKISERTNTVPMIEAFMWMQGESDSAFDPATNLYLETFNGFINDFTNTFKNNISSKFAVYDAGISETFTWPNATQINEIKRSRVDENNFYIDTNARLTTLTEPIGTVTDGAHYDAACYIDLGHMFADAYLSKVIDGYTHNAIEIEMPEKITLRMGEAYTISNPTVYFNDDVVNAKMSYFAIQHIINDKVVPVFEVNDNSTLNPLRVGDSQLRITAYYNNEVRTILVPVEVLPF